MDKRVPFFTIAALLAFALTPVADAEHRWVAVTVGATYLVLAGLTLLDTRSRRGGS
jgi:hypothetical protein